MTDNLGSGVSRVLNPAQTQFLQVIWQEGKPPLDSELNLIQALDNDWRRQLVLRDSPSGWLGNETNTSTDFVTNVNWSNWFKYGRQRTGEKRAIMWAVVNGWLIPVTGTKTGTPPGSPNDTDTSNVIALDPPPANSGDFRIDFVFLEVWLARVPPNPSATNKPAASAIWRYGNVEGGSSFLSDDSVDPALGFETTQRVQVQYRLRVAKGVVGLTTAPDGFDASVVKGQGASATASTFTFSNMRQELGDAGLWRAGDGTANVLGTVDGYTYAIPLTAVFRRNGVTWAGDPSQNLNGSYNRNPTAVDRTGILTFSTTPTLSANLSATGTTVTLASATNLPLPASPATPVLVQIGDELLTYTAITGTTLSGLVRGLNGTRADAHKSGSTVKVISTRPDGLFADQVAATDLLDLRHVVNPNGFDYSALLQSNLDKLLRGQLRANWKRSGAGPQGPYVFYQDKLSASASALGVTKLDAPDNIRQIFSDAAALQKIEVVLRPTGAAIPAAVNANWSLSITATQSVRNTPSQFSANDVVFFPVASLKAGVSGGDTDQIRWVNDGNASAVTLRIDGQNTPIPTSMYTVTPTNPTANDNLTITFSGSFPGTANQIYATIHALYGAGRGLSRRPDSIHNLTYIQPSTELLLSPSGVPSTNFPVKTKWAPLWSKFRSTVYKNNLPVTAEAYADLGSKSVVLTPFRRITWPSEFRTLDGTAANVSTSAAVVTSALGSAAGSTTFTDTSVDFVALSVATGMALVVSNGAQPGRYTITAVTNTTLTLDRTIATGSTLSYTIKGAQGLMPLLKADGVTAKWTTTDPLGLFSGSTDTSSSGFANTKNIYVTLPRHLVPGFGEVHCPILASDNSVFAEGVNFMCLTRKGTSPSASDRNYVPYNNGSLTYAAFSTVSFGPPQVAATYNAAFTSSGLSFAGIRQFTDTRGLGRQGLELPPFYGISRLFAVYEANDYKVNGSAYLPTDRAARGSGATNLLRQSVAGATFWIETDSDGDSTFVLNAECLDLSRSPNAIANFAAGDYVVEASIFGFDRGSFDLNQEFRLVMTRPTSSSLMRGAAGPGATEACDSTSRTANIGVAVTGPVGVLPGPATGTDSVVVNYSRTPYQGDAWGSQTNFIDIGYAPGAMQTATAFQLASTGITQSALTRPNQKSLEVLASIGFVTTLGTGRLSADAISASVLDARNVGYEDASNYPPASAIDARPALKVGALASGAPDIATQYLGASERLPLGALFRDKDFRGGSLGAASGSNAPLIYFGDDGIGMAQSNLTSNTSLEQTELVLDTASVATGAPGDAIVHVDGEQGNYSLLTNFRTYRGGSAFTASGSHPGGEVGCVQQAVTAPSASGTNVLSGRAYLVRNTVTNVGSSESSAGDELMMLIVTNVQQLKDTSAHPSTVLIGTNGTNEGYSAADLYRIEGHPLVNDHVRYDADPSSIALSKRVT
jgi:hypothetical protein